MGAQIALRDLVVIKESKNEKVIICYGCFVDDGIAAGDHCIGSSSRTPYANAGAGSAKGL
jgi:hypothetical protein